MAQERNNVPDPEAARRLRVLFDELYDAYTRREYVPPDPVEALYAFDDPGDREIAGLVASCLAYGRAASISRSVSRVLSPLSPAPRKALCAMTDRDLRELYAGFRHRFTSGDSVADLLRGAARAIGERGSLGACFHAALAGGSDIVRATETFVSILRKGGEMNDSFLLPSPADGSACKRLFLYIKWMSRRDAVDPGGWAGVPPSSLMMPVDTHIFRIGRTLGFTSRSQADLRACREITQAFAAICPEDPTKYDFCLSRFGIRSDLKMEHLLATCATAVFRG